MRSRMAGRRTSGDAVQTIHVKAVDADSLDRVQEDVSNLREQHRIRPGETTTSRPELGAWPLRLRLGPGRWRSASPCCWWGWCSRLPRCGAARLDPIEALRRE
jgi:hypothetical protein